MKTIHWIADSSRTVLHAHRGLIGKVAIWGGILQSLGLLGPFLDQLLIDRAYVRNRDPHFSGLLACVVIALALSVQAKTWRSYLANQLDTHLYRTLAVSFNEHIMALPVSFFDRHATGDIVHRSAEMRNSLRALLALFQTVTLSGCYITVIPILLVIKAPNLALAALSGALVLAAVTYIEASRSQDSHRRMTQAAGDAQACQTELFRNIRAVKSLNAATYCHAQYEQALGNLSRLLDQVNHTHLLFATSINAVTTLALSTCIVWGWILLFHNKLRLGELVAFVMYLRMMYGPITVMVTSLSQIQESVANMARVRDCFLVPRESATWPGGNGHHTILKRSVDDIRLQNVSFGYTETVPIVENVCAVFKRGEMTVITGESGSGKTTLLRLTAGFDRPTSGSIAIDGQDICASSLHDLRNKVTVVWQDTCVFTGSLMDTLTCGAKGISEDRLNDVVDKCQLRTLVSSLPGGFSTRLGESGILLSAGQRQRVGLAQALLRQTPILLLDEATANLDTDTECALMKRLIKEYADKILVVVSHRKDVAAMADTVYRCAKRRLSLNRRRIRDSSSDDYKSRHGCVMLGPDEA